MMINLGKHTEALKDIIDHFGKKAQILKATEECLELVAVMDSISNLGHDMRTERLTDEISDVLIMAEQLKMICEDLIIRNGLHLGRVQQRIDEKVQRTLERKESGYYDTTN
jgi:hypothetical protein